ncbi:hypothetical protein DPEC_G00361400 [Dallia pectoralis]|uniref:Uncharacterized protein n=1 Tax=Dallia pectoralis TaxID=75939 RepID=A0ACC2F154_DALPE|nr:hypothetical protein DPEC_G00361400 [Dallia pectoralis]
MWRTEDRFPASIWGLSPSDRGPARGWCVRLVTAPVAPGFSLQSRVVWECSPKRGGAVRPEDSTRRSVFTTVRPDPLPIGPGSNSPPWAHFPPAVCRDRLWVAGKGGAKLWLLARGRELYSHVPTRCSRGRGQSACCVMLPPRGRTNLDPGATVDRSGTVPSAGPTASRRRVGTGSQTGVRGQRQCRQPTRPVLETRTKESNAVRESEASPTPREAQ